jgi:hypothetical protein
MVAAPQMPQLLLAQQAKQQKQRKYIYLFVTPNR